MNKYEEEKYKENLEKVKEVEDSLKHLALRDTFIYPIIAHITIVREGIETILEEC